MRSNPGKRHIFVADPVAGRRRAKFASFPIASSGAPRHSWSSRSSSRRMFKTHYDKPGTAPATLKAPEESDPKATVIEYIEYNKDREKARRVKQIEDVFQCRDSGMVSWINIEGLGDVPLFRKLGEHFKLHPLALEDVFNTSQRPKVEDYPGHLFIVLQMVYADEKSAEICSEQVSLFLSNDNVISIQEEATQDVFEPVRQRILAGNPHLRSQGPDYLAYALIDAVVDHFFPLLEDVGEDLEELEDDLLTKPSKECLQRLHGIKRTLIMLRRAVWPQREMLSALMRDQTGIIKDSTKPYLRDCYDHLVQIMDIIENYREMSASLMDIYLSAISIRTNDIMRVLTVITSIFIPLTFIAGVYGMNFDKDAGPLSMPELKHPYGYAICIGIMCVIAFGQLFFFWRKGWLRKDS